MTRPTYLQRSEGLTKRAAQLDSVNEIRWCKRAQEALFLLC
jgi:hypothetical protein